MRRHPTETKRLRGLAEGDKEGLPRERVERRKRLQRVIIESRLRQHRKRVIVNGHPNQDLYEVRAAKRRKGLVIVNTGDGWTWTSNDIEHTAQLARDGWRSRRAGSRAKRTRY